MSTTGSVAEPTPGSDRAADIRDRAGIADQCPGLLRPFRAADGALIRIRLPGGTITGEALRALAEASVQYGNGELQITSRANLQMRCMALDGDDNAPGRLEKAVTDAGLLPSATHERVRNIVASPLTGRIGGIADLRAVIRDLDEQLCARPNTSRLPGRFLFGLDDGRGDVARLRCDLAVRAVSADSVRLLLGDWWHGPRVHSTEAAARLVALAERFLDIRGSQWHVHELPHGGAELLDEPPERATSEPPAAMPYGVLREDDGPCAVSAVVPLGALTAAQVAALATAAASGSGQVVLTPWRGVIIPDLPESCAAGAAERLAATGLVLAADSAWHGLSACTGAPGCRRATADTRKVATRIASGPPRSLPVHVVGCDRRCGAPAGRHTLVRAETRDGQTITTETTEGTAC